MRLTEEIAVLQLGVRGDEVVRRRTQAVAFGRLPDCSCPALRERSVELLRAAVDLACTFGARQEPRLCLSGSVARMQDPGDPEMLHVAYGAREHLSPSPGICQLVVGQPRIVAGKAQ